jgi:hypothetical protein
MKYIRGGAVTDLDEVRTRIEKGLWFYLRDKPIHFGFIRSMTFWAVAKFIKNGELYRTYEDQQGEQNERN